MTMVPPLIPVPETICLALEIPGHISAAMKMATRSGLGSNIELETCGILVTHGLGFTQHLIAFGPSKFSLKLVLTLMFESPAVHLALFDSRKRQSAASKFPA